MRLKVEPDVVALGPGDVTDLLVRVHNDGEDTCTPYLQVRGVDPDDVLLPDEVVAVPAGSVMTAIVRVRAAADAIPGDRRIAVAAEDLEGAQSAVSATTVLRIGARPDVAVEVDPVASVGRRGAKASTVLRNRSDRRLQVELEGRGDGVLVSFRPSRVTLDPGETKRVRTRMRRAQRSWFGEIRHGAVVTARGVGVPASTTATFTQKPSVPRPAVRGVAALTALAVWVAATVVVFNRINAEPEAGPDTGAVAAPAAPGPGRTSATGMFEEDTDDGVRLPVVIQGTIEGPRDAAGTTVTAERIGFGDQGTTSGFTKVVALAEVKLPRGNVLDVVRTSTDERGRFRIASGLVEDAFYRVTAVRAGFEVGSFIVSTSSDDPEVTIAIALEPATGSLAGTVIDVAGDPVGGATVVVTDGSAEYTTVTPSEGDGVGTWVLEGLATPATYQVLISRRGFASQTLIVELDGGQRRSGVDAVLVADLGTIVGRVTDANPDPNQPGVDQGVGALTVTLAGPEARETRTLTVAGDLRGTFDLPALPFGEYTVTFSGDGWVTRQAEVVVDRGLVRLDATVNRSIGLVQGWVWQTATGDPADFPGAFQGECRFPRVEQRDDGAAAAGVRPRPCGGVSVTVESDEGDVFATASANETGFFQIGGVPAGEYTLTLSRAGYESYVRAIEVLPGGTFDLNPLRTAAVLTVDEAVTDTDFIPLGLAAPPTACAGTVVVTLIDFRDGQGVPPIADAEELSAISIEGADDCDLIVRRVAGSGSYSIANAPLGSRIITVEGDDWPYLPATAQVLIGPVERASATLNILPSPRPLTLPAGTIAMTGADRTVFVQALNANGDVVGAGPVDGIELTAGGTSPEIELSLVSPDRNLRLRADGDRTPAPGYRTVTSDAFELPPGLDPFELPLLSGPAPRLTVVATTDVTFEVTETVVVAGVTPGSAIPVEGATVTAEAGGQSFTGTTDTEGKVTLQLDVDTAYDVLVTRDGYADIDTVITTGTDPLETVPLTLPADGRLRLVGEVSASVASIRVSGTGIDRNVAVVGGSYVVDDLPVDQVLRVDFRDADNVVLVSRWIQDDAAGNFTIVLDQDAEPSDLGNLVVTVEIAEHHAGSTPSWVLIELQEIAAREFFSIAETGILSVWKQRTDPPAAGIYTVEHSFEGLADPGASPSLAEQRFSLTVTLVTADGSTTPWSASPYRATGWTAEAGDPEASLADLNPNDSLPTVRFQTVPGPVEDLQGVVVPPAVPGDTQKIEVSWDPPSLVGGAASVEYSVEFRTGSGHFAPAHSLVGRSVDLIDLAPGTEYDIRVVAKNPALGAEGDGPIAEISRTTADVPGPPEIDEVLPSDGSLTIDFSAAASRGADIIRYEYSIDDGSSWISTGSDSPSSVVVAGLNNGETYDVRVRAVNLVGEGVPSDGVEGTPQPPFAVATGGVETCETADGTTVDCGDPLAAFKVHTFAGTSAGAGTTGTFTVTSAPPGAFEIWVIGGGGAGGTPETGENSGGGGGGGGLIYVSSATLTGNNAVVAGSGGAPNPPQGPGGAGEESSLGGETGFRATGGTGGGSTNEPGVGGTGFDSTSIARTAITIGNGGAGGTGNASSSATRSGADGSNGAPGGGGGGDGGSATGGDGGAAVAVGGRVVAGGGGGGATDKGGSPASSEAKGGSGRFAGGKGNDSTSPGQPGEGPSGGVAGALGAGRNNNGGGGGAHGGGGGGGTDPQYGGGSPGGGGGGGGAVIIRYAIS